MSKMVPDWEDQVRLLNPDRAVVFGSGMQSCPDGWFELAKVDQELFTGLEKSKIQGHKGTISLGRCGVCPALLFHGRVHSYEGYTKDQVSSLIRALASWGIKKVLLFNATGGLDSSLSPGDLVGVTEIWDATGSNWNVHRGIVPWFEIGAEGHPGGLKKGRYAMVSGPSYETPAEVKALGHLGANLVGMSSVWEIEEGIRLGISMQLISVVANLGTGLAQEPLTHQDVCNVMSQSEYKIHQVAREWLTS